MTHSEILSLLKFWLELGIRYSRRQCTPEEEFAVGFVIAALALLLGSVTLGPLIIARERIVNRLYLPKSHWLRKILPSRFSASKYYK